MNTSTIKKVDTENETLESRLEEIEGLDDSGMVNEGAPLFLIDATR